MNIAHINIGSNIGDSRSAIERAVAAVFSLSHRRETPGKETPGKVTPRQETPSRHSPSLTPQSETRNFPRRSSIIESEPWGFESPHKFLNIGVEILTGLSPLELLNRLQAIERAISPLSHRNPDGSYRDRIIDIDLIFMLPLAAEAAFSPDAETLEECTLHFAHPRLILPHPRALERDFVMAPIRQFHTNTQSLQTYPHPIVGSSADC